MDRLADLDELVLRCRTQNARDYIAEAISCYRIGAYRATIVSTWIAVVFDIIDKLRELSISGQKDAQNEYRKFEKYQEQINENNPQGVKNALEFERYILEKARSLDFLSAIQYTELTRLRDDRHKCAHPSFHQIEEPFRPNAELARLHLRNAIEYTLAQPPLQGTAALSVLKKLISSEYFPVEHEKAIEQLEHSPLSRGSVALWRRFIDYLIFDYFKEESDIYLSNRAISALRASFELNRELSEDRFEKQFKKLIDNLSDENMCKVFYFIEYFPDAWGFITSTQQERLRNFVRSAPTKDFHSILPGAQEVASLSADLKSRIENFNEDELTTAVNNYNLKNLAVPRAVDIYCKVKSWSEANRVYDNLIFPLFCYISKEQFVRIIRAHEDEGADLRGSYRFHDLIKQISKENIIPIDELKTILEDVRLSHFLNEDGDDDDGNGDDDLPF